MHPVAWMIVGGVFVFVGLVVMLSNIGDLRRRIRILRAPSCGPMVGSGTTARIEGRIVPGPEGMVFTPFSSMPAVWVEATVEGHARASIWKEPKCSWTPLRSHPPEC